jgi:hypothetical protein
LPIDNKYDLTYLYKEEYSKIMIYTTIFLVVVVPLPLLVAAVQVPKVLHEYHLIIQIFLTIIHTIQLHVTSAKKNIIGDYHVTGEIVNAGNDTIQSVKVIVHMYDGSNRLIELVVTPCLPI